ncbi:2'-5' RNA ligase [Candidatus Syntrophocurvum alkaliphilum]|uniref:RNA 2',3'-cyclic phosphodiesterase n=1 Tax=Candidatus Syntrophocurvum alkaliphilum TaxID=2293317 RepID=A0A6I6DGZ5_9FIRM|nr:RNA 2',3'-cyclic phosphodiesterase [Candidatus Syntrophocurvum alkaliphilum]QGT99640.1 2'-5' RNA ligase [Candidatus Syntrophocurvum alkaliphilum]
MRTFISIPIPKTVKDYVSKVKTELNTVEPDVKWVEYENYHLTVKFLGNINENQLKEIKHNLVIVGENCPNFDLILDRIGFFPNHIRPRVVWIGLKGELDKASFLTNRVDAYLGNLGFETERNHHFHLTLGRIRSEDNKQEFMKKCNAMQNNIKKLRFSINEFKLMESKLSSNGPQYSELGRFSLLG